MPGHKPSIARGASWTDSDFRASLQRLRPVLLTTVTTIVGLMPMVLGVNINLIERHISVGAPSSQWWTQLASSVAGGLAFATVLTLFLTPSLLMVQANAMRWWQERHTTLPHRETSLSS